MLIGACNPVLCPIDVHRYLHGSPLTGAPGERPPAAASKAADSRSNYFARDGFLPRLLADNDTFASGFGFIGLFPCSACDGRGAPIKLYGGPPQSGPYGWYDRNFDMILDANSSPSPHAPYVASMLIGCGLVLAIRCCDRFRQRDNFQRIDVIVAAAVRQLRHYSYFGPFPRIYQLLPSPHAPCDVLYAVP